MPMYEYVCQECEHPFESLVFDKDEPVQCPKCASARVAKQLSVPSAVVADGPTALPSACRSQGPPCGRQCSRWDGD